MLIKYSQNYNFFVFYFVSIEVGTAASKIFCVMIPSLVDTSLDFGLFRVLRPCLYFWQIYKEREPVIFGNILHCFSVSIVMSQRWGLLFYTEKYVCYRKSPNLCSSYVWVFNILRLFQGGVHPYVDWSTDTTILWSTYDSDRRQTTYVLQSKYTLNEVRTSIEVRYRPLS